MKNISRFVLIMLLPFFFAKREPRYNKVGGQAIIEGVMMRSRQKISWAIRKPDGETIIERFPFISLTKKVKILALPVLRGAINLYEALEIGYKALSRSAQIAAEEPTQTPIDKKKETIALIASFVLAFVISLAVFMYLPMIISQYFLKNSVIGFNMLAGTLRIFLFVLYLVCISLWKDIRRIFEYHGAEHKAIFAFEEDKELTIENMKPYPTLHPRCGTSFLLLVAIVCIFLFSIIDALVTVFIAPYPSVVVRFLVHVCLIPLVAGLSYEVLRLSDRFQHVPLVRLFIMPGLWLQKITTREPDDIQLQVASAALKASL